MMTTRNKRIDLALARRIRRTVIWAAGFAGLGTALAFSPPMHKTISPQCNYVYPSGGEPGSEFEVRVGGVNLETVNSAIVSGEGVRAVYIGRTSETNLAKARLPVHRFKVVIEPDAKPGIRELRICNPVRICEPLMFDVRAMRELTEPITARDRSSVRDAGPLPVCLNGSAGLTRKSADFYRFQATAGEQIVAYPVWQTRPFTSSSATPKLNFYGADDSLCKSEKFELGRGLSAKVLTIPETGVYKLRVGTSVTNNINSAVYRVLLGKLPLITGISPTEAKKSSSTNVSLDGFNLPQNRIRLFTGGKDEALCREAIFGDSLALPGLDFKLISDLPPAPDFRVWMSPASVSIPAGGSGLVWLQAERQNGYTGPIQVSLSYPPLGICFEGGYIPAGESKGVMTVSTDSHRYPKTSFSLDMAASANVNGETIVRPVEPVRQERDGQSLPKAMGFDYALGRVAKFRVLNVASNFTARISAKAGGALDVYSPYMTKSWEEIYEPYVVWPESGLQVTVNMPDENGRRGFLLKADPKHFPAGSAGDAVVGLRVIKTGISVATSRCFKFRVTE